MKTALAFGTGMIAGVVVLTTAVTTVKPIRKQAAKMIASMIMFGLEHDPANQEKAVEFAYDIIHTYEKEQ